METYLTLFADVIRNHAENVGHERAIEQAKKAGLGVSDKGHIVSCSGNPQLVLLRLIKHFTADGSMLAVAACTPLINLLAEIGADSEASTDKKTDGAPA